MQDEMENKLNALLSDPELMKKIAAMAQSLQSKEEVTPEKPSVPQLDLSMLQRISGLAQNSRIDSNQEALLRALAPYINRQRISKLENAMRAAKMARVAAALLGTEGIKQFTGR